MTDLVRRLRPLLAAAGAVAAVAVLVPPVGTAARHYVVAQAVQFAVLALVVPALLVLGAPWRLVSRDLAGRVAAARSHRPPGPRPWAILAGYIVVALAWRLPVAVNALVAYPVLTLAEAVTVIAAGCALWLELADSPPVLPRISRPQRALFAAVPMWAMWASAYIMGFSGSAWFSALAHGPGPGLGTIADQELAAALLWAIPALCFVPVVFVSMLAWIRDSADPDEELRAVPGPGRPDQPGRPVLPRPPRGWRLPSS